MNQVKWMSLLVFAAGIKEKGTLILINTHALLAITNYLMEIKMKENNSKLYYRKLLENSYDLIIKTYEYPPRSRLDYVGEYIFNFTTYDSKVSELFAYKAIEVLIAINNRTTYYYIENKSNYKWFLLMCNMPFFIERIEWGFSIRSAWWITKTRNKIKLETTGLYEGDKQITTEMEFNEESWIAFTTALIEFVQNIEYNRVLEQEILK